MTLRIGFLASYNGSGMRAVVQAIEAGHLDATPAVIISNNPGSQALVFARDRQLPHVCINAHRAGGEDAADADIARTLMEAQVDLVVLSGYMKRIGPKTLAAFANRILNIHPSLLPNFGGQGMYGMRVHEAVIAAGVQESGATVHVVDDEYDHGRILAQARVPVLPGDSAQSLRQRVAEQEGPLYVQVLQRIARGELHLV
ncbi:phosphoribosylglycinamide formyltransferase [Alicyclobacillus hesperidum]|uniref:Phosphoribosylglycinamide formyltransferase n=1 Tax=Alicyclobacillus hesperidum TaxID=89784 RepID=A0A1H2W527_9BACL|nr:phosphoribosylglycinamide formyltransferase [Alicyclobacillus hesperidum]GLV14801.1 phosphoribosylglycinamide formyltransferase [Alicyclobacillus hesperidum]SDW75641.1 phosphoribosylglycinamide formyltransferase-1 [Alicyclobacillus hesperidum]